MNFDNVWNLNRRVYWTLCAAEMKSYFQDQCLQGVRWVAAGELKWEERGCCVGGAAGGQKRWLRRLPLHELLTSGEG